MKDIILLLSLLIASFTIQGQVPIPHAHAHNDYSQKRPLDDALKYGFTSIEIDVYSHKEKIKVAHWPRQLKKKPTLEELYLLPLQERISKNQGTVFPGDSTPLTLMIDLKKDKAILYTLLKAQFQQLEHLLKIDTGPNKKWGPLKIILSGNPPMDSLRQDEDHYFSADVALQKITPHFNSAISTRASMNFNKLVSWKKKKGLSVADRDKISTLVKAAQAQGLKTRFWATPDKVQLWQELLDLGVDWINVDDLKKYHRFITERMVN